MSYSTQNASGDWPAPLAAAVRSAGTTPRRALKYDTLAARLLVGLRNNLHTGQPETTLLQTCGAIGAPTPTINHAFAALEDRGLAAYHDDGWRITKAGQEAADELIERGTPQPTPAADAEPPAGQPTSRTLAPISAPGITRLAHCLGGQLDDNSSGRAAGRTGGDDWRAFPSRQGDWLVYRDGRRVHITDATR